MIIEINPEHPQPRRVQQVVEALQRGALVAYPTDTVYGIGCDILNHQAVERLHALVEEIKGTPDHAPLSFICSSLSDISRFARVNDYAYRTLRRMLPGPYTFVLEASRKVPKIMREKRKTVGIRIPDAPIPLAIVDAMGGNPLLTTSATEPDGELIPDPWSLQERYGHAVEVVVDGGYVFPEPSTVIDFSEDYPRLIRQGKGELGDLEIVEYI